jgi:hypothetical protein
MAAVDIDDELRPTTKTTKKMRRLKKNRKVILMTSRASLRIESTTTATSAVVDVANATKMMKSHEVMMMKRMAMMSWSTTWISQPE